ncbi:carbohydrate kinase family protein [Azoarcus indigens]|uniref:Adenosine kinase n=1 Tax=Azoarcus indigens TaxID=29545 RepID=A0A4R6DYT6_9RHOO|nr:carbohydrate kinase family protein [Azoarcus indigens]NMG64966.1 carbohydrate kinase family protein [Azoarcus indigens]TDN50503.1 adenosine kinase [Azoarcus indigens]
MSILVCGSMAYDSIMVFHDRFKNHILPEQIHILNLSFLVPEMRREFGGCAGNIAYNLRLLGADPLIVATVGDDAAPYFKHLDELGLRRNHVRQVEGSFTAQAFITTDLDDNQITAFHPGAMMHSQLNRVADIPGASLGIVSPDGPEGMLAHVEGFAAGGVPFVFDPGQALPILSGEQLLRCLKLARYCTVNDYEARLMSEKTGRSIAEMAAEVKALVVTLGGDGSQIYVDGECLQIPAVKADAIADPTGCGDAYRAGLLYGLAQGWDWPRTGRLAAVMGAIKIASRGPQNHRPSREDIAERYRSAFGELPW